MTIILVHVVAIGTIFAIGVAVGPRITGPVQRWRAERRIRRECSANLRQVMAMLELALAPPEDPRGR